VGVADILVVESVPLAVSFLGIAAGAANKIGFSSIGATQGGAEVPWRDMGKVMCERSSCGYSLDAGKNLQVLSDELDALCASPRTVGDGVHSSTLSAAFPTPASSLMHKNINPRLNAAVLRQTLQLYRVWGWVDRVEALHDEQVTITSCGVVDIVKSSSCISIEKKHPRFDLRVYSSAGTSSEGARERIRQVCGWASALVEAPDVSSGGGKQAKAARVPHHAAKTVRDDDEEEEEDGDGEEEEVGMSGLEALLDECEVSDSVERASALAMWHGHPELAIRILQQHAEKHMCVDFGENGHVSTNHASGHGWDEAMTPEYLQLLNLAAMCFAGHGGGHGGGNMWVSMCQRVLAQLNKSRRAASAYLAAICRFLLESLPQNSSSSSSSSSTGDGAATATDNSSQFDCVIRNEALILEDRLGFASFYLADAPLLAWVQILAAEYTKEGRLEGLLLCGLQGDGTHILQEYVNRYEDVQTAALLVGRNIHGKLPDGPDGLRNLTGTAFSEWSWLYEYRIFLNRSQLFMSRASLDVELGRRQRIRTEAEVSGQASGGPSKSAAKAAPAAGIAAVASKPTSAATAAVDRRSSNSRVMYALPAHNDFPHIFLRCNYCSSSLPVDAMQQQQHTAFLRKQKPIINFCPSCKKPLPRCYVCQLYMGLVNPHAEVSRILAQKRRLLDRAKAVRAQSIEKGTNIQQVKAVNSHAVPQDLDEHNVLEFGRWLFFCQRCKHGGHASCIDHWFEGESESVAGGEARRTVCGVNGCDCQCSYR